MDLTLVIGNKNYSSWSLRAWLLLKHVGAPFSEVRIPLSTPQTRERIAVYSPSGLIPVLIDGSITVWDSLAICEHLAERFPASCGWPTEQRARAVARSISAEMHAGFVALRGELPMNCRARRVGLVPSAAAQADIDRIITIWRTCREQFGCSGEWLFGTFTPADAMFAPVVLRFVTYGVHVPGLAGEYLSTVQAHPAVREWVEAAVAESEIIQAEERGSPIL